MLYMTKTKALDISILDVRKTKKMLFVLIVYKEKSKNTSRFDSTHEKNKIYYTFRRYRLEKQKLITVSIVYM